MADCENEAEDDEGDVTIARRTRSHLRIDELQTNDNLDFPDVDMSLYQNPDSEVDTEYKKFLNDCYSEQICTDTNTDDNDPEYVYNDDIFSHGWRYDLNELSEFHHDESSEFKPDIKTQVDKIQSDQKDAVDTLWRATPGASQAAKSPIKVPRRKIDMFADPEFARILNQQLRQHIQLLTQTYLLTKNTTNMRDEADEAKNQLNSYMKMFKNKTKPSNLIPAVTLVNAPETPKDLRSSIRLSWRPLPIPDSIKAVINNNPNVFIYPSLLPQVAFSFLPENLIPKKPKINFTTNEDKLLAYALHEFKGESSPYAFIASLLMTAKTKTQIINHIKNIKRPGNKKNENNPINLYFDRNILPEIDLDSDSSLVQPLKDETPSEVGMSRHDPLTQLQPIEPAPTPLPLIQDVSATEEPVLAPACDSPNNFNQELDDLMNMDLDDLMAASTKISKSSALNINSESNNNKNIKNLKLRKSMLNLMSHNFSLSEEMGDLITDDFLKTAQQKLSEINYISLLQLLSGLTTNNGDENNHNDLVVAIYQDITKFLYSIHAPKELHERVVLFLNLEQATRCGCALNYLHWMRFFEFMEHVKLYHDGGETLEKKLSRLIDALQKDDAHKTKLAIGNLVNKHPFLKSEFDSLPLEGKPPSSLFISEEDFDDVTEPIAMFNSADDKSALYNYEHFNSKISEEELNYASQACPCHCHNDTTVDGQPSQHCGKCNLKFMKGRMYLVNKIKPNLAEWSYVTPPERLPTLHKTNSANDAGSMDWTFQEDREILEFCRLKAEQNEETISFDTSTFEELIGQKRSFDQNGSGGCLKRTAREIAERFNHLMDIYRDENNTNLGSQ